jgi:serine phosphatase RsbU (regulator of sigma subunit)
MLEIKGDRKSVGVNRENETTFTNHSFELQKGDFIYLFSDGYADQNNRNRDKFGMLAFKKLLNSIALMPINRQREKLASSLKVFSEGDSQRDDILVVGLEV